MSYPNDDLTFNQLRTANLHRLPQFRDKLGRVCHSEPDGSDWSPNDWMTAVCGEVGELAGELKSLKRGDYADLGEEEIKLLIGREAADVVIYLDLLMSQFGINLGDAVTEKFNLVSERVKATTRL